MSARAYSYVRFSTAEQLKGKSLERQTEAAATYCAKHSLTLDTHLSLHDLGVSAFRGKNASTGALKVFLDRVDDGTVPRGSYLLIEAFDRMSRESAYDAQLTLQNIINAGITVVTLLDGKHYSVQILRSDPLALIYAILLMSRGHEESATKARRIADAWARKRLDALKGKRLTRSIPKWLRVNAAGEFSTIPARVKAVRLMFDRTLEGAGLNAIAREFNAKGIPTSGGGKFWRASLIAYYLHNRKVLGEFQPRKSDPTSRTRKNIPVGPPIKNYFPVIVNEKTFNRVQRLTQPNLRPPKCAPSKVVLLMRLGRCLECGGPIERTGKRSTESLGRYVCLAARHGAGCAYRSITVSKIDNALVKNADEILQSLPAFNPAIRARLQAAEKTFKATEEKRWQMSTVFEDTPSQTAAKKLQELEAKEAALKADVEQLKAELAVNEPKYIRDRAQRMHRALKCYDLGDARDVNAALRECFEKIVLCYNREELELHWRHGGKPTVISYSPQ